MVQVGKPHHCLKCGSQVTLSLQNPHCLICIQKPFLVLWYPHPNSQTKNHLLCCLTGAFMDCDSWENKGRRKFPGTTADSMLKGKHEVGRFLIHFHSPSILQFLSPLHFPQRTLQTKTHKNHKSRLHRIFSDHDFW